jgi:hypothetical protein
MLRELVSRFNSTIAARRASVRRNFNVPVKVCFAPDKDGVKQTRSWDDAFLSGETTDVSHSGIGFAVSAIRIRDRYLVGQERLLNVELDLSGTKVRMQVRGRRYEKVGIHLSEEKYFVGAEIINVDEADKQAYEHFLGHGHKPANNLAAVLELGTK